MSAQQQAAGHRRSARSPSSRSRPAVRSRCSTADAAVGGLGAGAHHEIGRGGQPVQLGGDDGAETPGHAVADHRVADGLADDETGPRARRRRGHLSPTATGRDSLLGPFGEVVEHHGRPPGAPSGPDDRGELRTPAQACLRGQHVRRRASRDPCADGRRGSPGPRGSASAAGTRGSSTDGGCSAGTCACSRGTPTTRHRRCTSAGGRVCARLGTAVRRSPVTPEAGPCGRHAPTDSSQHNRGIATADGRAHPDRPWSTRTRPGRRTARRADAPGRAPRSLPGCGRGC